MPVMEIIIVKALIIKKLQIVSADVIGEFYGSGNATDNSEKIKLHQFG
jgi:hypothetical protein